MKCQIPPSHSSSPLLLVLCHLLESLAGGDGFDTLTNEVFPR